MEGDLGSILGGIAGLIAAVGFVALVGYFARSIAKLGNTFDAASDSIRELTAHTVPILDESALTIQSTNSQLEKVDTITTSAAEVSENVSALTALFAATVGGPMVKVAAFTYGVRNAMGNRSGKGKR